MTLETVFLICFVLGLSLSVLAALGGGHFHLGRLHVAHVHFSRWRFGRPPSAIGGHSTQLGAVNGFTLAAFLCWCGGAGYLLERYSGLVVSLILGFAVLSGLTAATVLFLFLARVLLPHERVLTAEETATAGALALVSSAIREDGVGEVQFSQNGGRRFAAARSQSGMPIPRGAEVIILRYEQGIAWVLPWEEAAGDAQSGPTLSNHSPLF